jgi:hypothetical protein
MTSWPLLAGLGGKRVQLQPSRVLKLKEARLKLRQELLPPSCPGSALPTHTFSTQTRLAFIESLDSNLS